MKVFISHTSADHDFVWKLANQLISDGIDVWVDEWEIKAGDSIVQKVNDALAQSSFLLIVLSENSINSDWVLKELNVSLMRQLTSKNIKILPVLLELRSMDIPPLLSDIYAVKFSRDFINADEYNKLIDPILSEKQSNSIKKYQDQFFENVQHIDLIIDKESPTKHEVSFVLNLLEEEHYYNYFFKKVEKLHWYFPLKENGYFEPSDKIRPKEIENKGSYIIPFWPVLEYLIKVSKKTIEPQNEIYIEELFSIMRRVTQYHTRNDRSLDNYRIWYSFIKIMSNIPTGKISLSDLELCKEWLDTRFGTDLHGTDLVRKLLPKFLDSDFSDDFEKAEFLIEISTDVIWKTDNRRLSRDNIDKKIPTLSVDPHWILESLKSKVESIAKKCSHNILVHLSNKILEILNSKRDTTWKTLSIENHEILIIGKKINEKTFVVTIGKVVPDEHRKEDQFSLVNHPPEYDNKYEFQIADCPSRDIFSKEFSNFIEQNGTYSVFSHLLLNESYNIYDALFEDYSYISFPSMYGNPRTGKSDPEIVLIILCRDILSEKIKIDPDGIRPFLESIIEHKFKYTIFYRLLLFALGVQYEHYNDLLIKVFGYYDNLRLFENSNYQPEIYELLKRNIEKFTFKEKQIIADIIEKGPQFYLPEEDKDSYVIYWKIKWLAPIKSDPKFKTLFDECKKIHDIDETKIKYKSETITRSGPGPSPITNEQLDQMAINELSAYFQNFKTSDEFYGPTVGGLATIFKQAILNNPLRYSNSLNSFLPCGYIYIYEILSAYKEIWNKKQEIDWNSILSFMVEYLSTPGFWDDQFIVERDKWLSGADSNWVAGILSELIGDGVRDDNWAIPFILLPKAEILLIEILNNLDNENDISEVNDYVTYSLNTVAGKSLSTLILLSLRVKRNSKTRELYEGGTWDSKFKTIYETFLISKNIESYTWLGRYAPNFYFLDKQWTVNWIDKIEKNIGSNEWAAFFNGYLSMGHVYDELYYQLNASYHYGLQNKFSDEHDNEYIVQHIGLSYLQGKENIDDPKSLISHLITRWDYEQILNLIDFFWMHRDKDSSTLDQVRPLIIQFWRIIIERKIKPGHSVAILDNNKRILSRLSRLTSFLDSINEEIFSWLLMTSKFIHIDYNSSFFIESLDRFENFESIRFVGLIFLEMLNHHVPDYDKKHIESIVNKQYSNGYKETANAICNFYGRKGYEFLRKEYENNNR